MRYILNFNPAAASALTSAGISTVSFTKTRSGNIVIREDADGVAFSPLSPTSNRYKSRLNKTTARTAGLKGSQRYLLKAGRGKTPSFTLTPHSQVRNSKQVSLDAAAVTVSITERAA